MGVAASVSPCVGICQIDRFTGYCSGCGRSSDEIATWSSVTDTERKAIWDSLPDRLETLGTICRRLPWSTRAIREFVAQGIERDSGAWVMGVVGAVGEFRRGPGANARVHVDGTTLVAATEGAAMRFRLDDDVHALSFDLADGSSTRRRIILAVKRERGTPPTASTLTHLGADGGALAPSAQHDDLFDLGLGRQEARFCMRIRDGVTRQRLLEHVGTAYHQFLSKIAPFLVEASPVRVIETALGRMEVSTPIPMPGGTSPEGPHTHLLPDHLASERTMPAGLELPEAYLPGAIFYPE